MAFKLLVCPKRPFWGIFAAHFYKAQLEKSKKKIVVLHTLNASLSDTNPHPKKRLKKGFSSKYYLKKGFCSITLLRKRVFLQVILLKGGVLLLYVILSLRLRKKYWLFSRSDLLKLLHNVWVPAFLCHWGTNFDLNTRSTLALCCCCCCSSCCGGWRSWSKKPASSWTAWHDNEASCIIINLCAINQMHKAQFAHQSLFPKLPPLFKRSN